MAKTKWGARIQLAHCSLGSYAEDLDGPETEAAQILLASYYPDNVGTFQVSLLHELPTSINPSGVELDDDPSTGYRRMTITIDGNSFSWGDQGAQVRYQSTLVFPTALKDWILQAGDKIVGYGIFYYVGSNGLPSSIGLDQKYDSMPVYFGTFTTNEQVDTGEQLTIPAGAIAIAEE